MPTTNHIKFGNGLTVLDEGAGVIRVDASGGGGSADLEYGGSFVPATSYADGDIVVADDGIAYMCVVPTSDAPTPWPGGAMTGPPGPPGQWTQLTQAQYDALSPPDPNTLYVIVG